MMNKAAVEQSIENIKKCFLQKIMTEKISVEDNCITWRGYKAGIIKGVSYPREYQILLDQGQYSILLLDGSFFQFYFSFRGDELRSSRMAYYPVPKIINESLEDLNDFELMANPWLKEVFAEMALEMEFNSGQLSANSHIRFDYDASVNSHAKTHFQFGGINEFRITSKVLVLPFVFFERVLLDFHLDWVRGEVDREKYQGERNHGVRNCFKFDGDDSFYITT